MESNYEILFSNNDIIYIDTCSLMQSKKTEKVIETIRPYLLATSKRIIITPSVSHELTKHRIRNNEQTIHLVEKAYEIIEKYNDIFDLEDYGTSKQEIFTAFADPKLIARMTIGKDHHSQLLITNDKKLSVDALNINTLKSCKGKPVTVYSISEFGELEEFSAPQQEEPKVIIKEIHKEKSSFENVIHSLYLITTGLAIGIGGKYAYKYAKNINWRAFV